MKKIIKIPIEWLFPIFILGIVIVWFQMEQMEQIKRMREIKGELKENNGLITGLEARLSSVKEEMNHRELILSIIACESSGRHDNVWGDNGRSYGIAQFQERTFYNLAKKSGMQGLKWEDRKAQIRLLSWAVKNGHGKEWTCYNKLQKRG